MFFSQHYLACLSHASYLIGDQTSGRAVVVDPQRDVNAYLDEAAAAGLVVERVIETHLHADFLSGHLEVAARTGAVISYGEGAQTEFAIDQLRDGQRLSLGDVTLEVITTPGHTPESICIAVYEHAADVAPHAVLTGDTLFIGDVGRPDLLASSGSGLSGDALARQLYRSLRTKLMLLPDETRVFPAHGAGSSCGRQLSTETSSTIGEQRKSNYALQPMSEDAFVRLVTEGQPPKPTYFMFDAVRNRVLRELLDEDRPPPMLGVEETLARHRRGAQLLDMREPPEYAAAHLAGSVNVGLQGRFAEWAADVLDPGSDVVLVGDRDTGLAAKVRLGRVGFDRVAGQLGDLPGALTAHPELVEVSSRLTAPQLADLLRAETVQIVDVRGPGETAEGTIPGAKLVPLAVLVEVMDSLDNSAPTVVYCASGYRSAVAASVLRCAGFDDVSDLLGGYTAWAAAGLPATPAQ